MKHLFQSIIAIAVLALCISLPPSALARPPRAVKLCGVVQKIDRESKTLTVLPATRSEPLELKWDRDTGFLLDWKFVESESLKENRQICVYYHSPFIGKRRAIKVVLKSNQSKSNVLSP